jgi:alpha-beta hydrolase superfamily lysophospholipase
MTTNSQALAISRTALATRRRSYSDPDVQNWVEYQKFFPEAMRSNSPENTPTEEWWAWNGLDVHLDRMAVPESPIKVIVIHGAGAYGRVMAPASVIARRHGYETVSPDMPGYGLTKVPHRRMTYDLWIDCVCDLIDAEVARDGRPVLLFGVSLGGLLAYHAAARSRKVIGLLATTMADPREAEVRQGFARNKLLGSAGLALVHHLRGLIDGVPLPIRYLSKMDRISNIPELSRLCERDRLGGGNWVPARFLRTLLYTAPDIEPEDFDLCPVMLTLPGVDRMTEISLSRRFFDRLKTPKKRLVILEGASHMPTERPGVDQMERAVLEFLSEISANVRR